MRDSETLPRPGRVEDLNGGDDANDCMVEDRGDRRCVGDIRCVGSNVNDMLFLRRTANQLSVETVGDDGLVVALTSPTLVFCCRPYSDDRKNGSQDAEQ